MNSTLTIEVRSVQQCDLQDLSDILNEIIVIGGSTAYEGVFDAVSFDTTFISGDTCVACLVALVDGRPMGFQAVAFYPTLPEGWVDIGTFARVTGKVAGVGTALFTHMREHLAQKCQLSGGVTLLNASIRSDNHQGLSFYTKMGFEDYSIDEAVIFKNGKQVDRISKKYVLER